MKDLNKKYKYPVIATDVVILTVDENELKVLLIKMKKKPYEDCWAMPGGLVGGDESVDDAAKRQLFTKAGIKNVFLEQLYTFGEVDRDPFGRVISVSYFALISSVGINLKTAEEYEDIQWFSVDNLPKLAYDHKKIIKCAVERLRAKLEYTNIVYSLLPVEFTMREMQKAYEIILDKKLDKRNFRKKIFSLNLIKNIGKKTAGDTNRPAELYKFIKKSPQIVQIL